MVDSRLFLRRRDAAHDLGVSQSQMLKWERAGVIQPVRLPGLRSIRYDADDVRALAQNIRHGRLSSRRPPVAKEAEPILVAAVQAACARVLERDWRHIFRGGGE